MYKVYFTDRMGTKKFLFWEGNDLNEFIDKTESAISLVKFFGMERKIDKRKKFHDYFKVITETP